MMNLIYRGKKTLACKKLLDSSDPAGTVSTRLMTNYPSDEHRVLQRLLKHGWVTLRSSGPRGGSRYHITEAGTDALTKATS